MVCGFLGTVISLERAVALDRAWAFLAPGCTGVGAILTLAGVGGAAGPVLSVSVPGLGPWPSGSGPSTVAVVHLSLAGRVAGDLWALPAGKLGNAAAILLFLRWPGTRALRSSSPRSASFASVPSFSSSPDASDLQLDLD